MKFVVDLDDTLVSSTQLNNDAYNFALEEFGYDRIVTDKRITRELIRKYNNLDKIISLKQQYFTQNWLTYRLITNNTLIEKLILNKKENCYLWTKADKQRTNAILDLCNLRKYFKKIIFDKKENFNKSVALLKGHTNSNNFIIYENNFEFFTNQNVKLVDMIRNNKFNINGYLVL